MAREPDRLYIDRDDMKLYDKLADEWIFFIAPKIIGGDRASVKGKGVWNITDAVKLKDMRWEASGDDLIIRGRSCLRA